MYIKLKLRMSHGVHSSFLSFLTCKSFIEHRETWLPLFFTYLSACSITENMTKLLSPPQPVHTHPWHTQLTWAHRPVLGKRRALCRDALHTAQAPGSRLGLPTIWTSTHPLAPTSRVGSLTHPPHSVQTLISWILHPSDHAPVKKFSLTCMGSSALQRHLPSVLPPCRPYLLVCTAHLTSFELNC